MADHELRDIATEKRIGIRKQLLEAKGWTATPNWFEIFFRGAPPDCTCLLWYILRKTVGYSSGTEEIETSIVDLENETHITRPMISRWLKVLAVLHFIEYFPATNGARKSLIRIFPVGLPTEEQVYVAVAGISRAVKAETAKKQEYEPFGRGDIRFPARDFAELVWKNAIDFRARRLNTKQEIDELHTRCDRKNAFVW